MIQKLFNIIFLLHFSLNTKIEEQTTIQEKIQNHLHSISKKTITVTTASIITLCLIYYCIKKINQSKNDKKDKQTNEDPEPNIENTNSLNPGTKKSRGLDLANEEGNHLNHGNEELKIKISLLEGDPIAIEIRERLSNKKNKEFKTIPTNKLQDYQEKKYTLPESFFKIINPFNIKTKYSPVGCGCAVEIINKDEQSILENLAEGDYQNLIKHLFSLYDINQPICNFFIKDQLNNIQHLKNQNKSVPEIILANNYQQLNKTEVNKYLIGCIYDAEQLKNQDRLSLHLEGDKYKILIAQNENNDTCYGFIEYKKINTNQNTIVYYINSLATHIDYQRKGVMNKLMEHLKKDGCDIYLYTNKDSSNLIANSSFYKKQGFTQYKKLEDSLNNNLIKNLPNEEATSNISFFIEYSSDLYVWESPGTIETIKYDSEIKAILHNKDSENRTTYPIFETEITYFENEEKQPEIFWGEKIHLNTAEIGLIESKNNELSDILSQIKSIYNPKSIEVTHNSVKNKTFSKNPNILANLSQDETFQYINMLCGLYSFSDYTRERYFPKNNSDTDFDKLNECDLFANNSFNYAQENITEFILYKIYNINKSIDSKLCNDLYYKKGDTFDIRLYKYRDDIIFYKKNNEIVAFVSYNQIYDLDNESCLKGIWINFLATKMTYQKQGIMKKLINYLKNKNVPIALTSSRSSSQHASGPRFYTKNQFQAIEIKAFLEYKNDTKNIFYQLAKSQKDLYDNIPFFQVYTWTPIDK